MTPKRDRPYSQFNFQVGWVPAANNESDTLYEGSIQAGFQEVSGLGEEITVAEYRAGNASSNEPLEITGTVKTPDVTFKRGIIRSRGLYEWLQEVRSGAKNQLKEVTVRLMSEDRRTVAQQWRLINARPIKYTGASLNGKGTELAIEELVLAAERIEQS